MEVSWAAGLSCGSGVGAGLPLVSWSLFSCCEAVVMTNDSSFELGGCIFARRRMQLNEGFIIVS